MAIVEDVTDEPGLASSSARPSSSSSSHSKSTRNRKPKSNSRVQPQTATDIPLARPPTSSRSPKGDSTPGEPFIKLVDADTDPEVARILRASGAGGVDSDGVEADDEDDVGLDAGDGDEEGEVDGTEWDEFFDSMVLTVPFGFLYLMLDILTNLSYSRHPPWDHFAKNFLVALPTIGIIILYSSRYITSEIVRLVLILASAASGMRLIWLVNKASYLTVMEQAPAVGTLWIITIVQLPLGRAVLALAVVAGWSWWAKMKFRP